MSTTWRNVIDMDAIRAAGLKLGVDPLGGASRPLLGADQRACIGLDIDVVNPKIDPTFSLHDASTTTARSAWTARAPTRWPGWSSSRTSISVAFGNDPDSDRHGIVTPSAGLMNPNHYLAVAIRYLLDASARLAARPRPSARRWSAAA